MLWIVILPVPFCIAGFIICILILYQRRKGRDLFDLHKALTTHENLDVNNLIKCYLEYITFSAGQAPKQKQFIDNMEAKMQDSEFLGDIVALIRPSYEYDHKAAFAIVKSAIIEKLR